MVSAVWPELLKQKKKKLPTSYLYKRGGGTLFWTRGTRKSNAASGPLETRNGWAEKKKVARERSGARETTRWTGVGMFKEKPPGGKLGEGFRFRDFHFFTF